MESADKDRIGISMHELVFMLEVLLFLLNYTCGLWMTSAGAIVESGSVSEVTKSSDPGITT